MTSRSRILVLTAFVVAAAGGAYVGLFSCGGYAWHQWLIVLTISALMIGAGLASAAIRRTWVITAILFAVVLATYRIFIAVAWPFYLGPTSVRDFVAEFSHALIFGPC
jgi:hypothetical protein